MGSGATRSDHPLHASCEKPGGLGSRPRVGAATVLANIVLRPATYYYVRIPFNNIGNVRCVEQEVLDLKPGGRRNIPFLHH